MVNQVRKLSAAILMIGCVILTEAAATNPVKLLTEQYAPYAWKSSSDQVTGISTDIVNELMRRAAVATSPPVILPLARAIFTTIHTPNTRLFSTARTADREANFRWIGPIAQLDWVLFARTSSNIHLHDLQAARPYRIGSYVGNAFVTRLTASGLNVETTSSDQANPKKLLLGRIDLWAAGRISGLQLIRDLHVEGIEQVFAVEKLDLYLACNLGMKQLDADRLSAILDEMYRDDTIRLIYERYGYGDDTPTIGR